MTAFPESSPLEVQHVELRGACGYICSSQAAAALTEPSNLELLLVFLNQEWTIKEAAQRLRWSMVKTYRTTQKLMALDLLKVSQQVPRKGRAIKRYTTTHECFFLPYHLTPVGTLEQLLDLLEKDARQMLFRSTARVFEAQARNLQQEVGLHLFQPPEGHPSVVHALWTEQGNPHGIVRSLLDPQATPLWNEWALLRLDHADAKELQLRLSSLVREYVQKQGAGRFLLRVGLTPGLDGVE